MFAPLNEINKILGIQSTIEQLVLCQKCYNDTYTTVSTTRAPCSSCGATPKTGKTFCRHSPDAETVSKYLQNTTGETVQIGIINDVCVLPAIKCTVASLNI